MKKILGKRMRRVPSLLVLLSWTVTTFAVSGRADLVTEAKDKSMPIVATKIQSFDDEAFATSVAFSPDGEELATEFCQQFQVRIWKWQSYPKIIKTLAKPPGSGSPDIWDAIRYSPDGKYLSLFHARTSIPPEPATYARVWNRSNWAIAHDFAEQRLGLAGGAIAFVPSSKMALEVVDRSGEQRGGARNETLRAYDVSNWQLNWGLDLSPLAPLGLEVSPNGLLVAVGGDVPTADHALQSRVVIIDLAQQKIVRSIDPFPLRCSMERMSWSEDSKRLAIGSMKISGLCPMDGTSVAVFDVSTGSQISEDHSPIVAHVHGIRYTPDGKYLIEGGLGQTVRIWDSMQQKLLQTIDSDVSAMAVSSDGRNLALANGKVITVWELR